MTREDFTGYADQPIGRQSARRTLLERFALRFPGVVRRISAIVVRLPIASNPSLRQFRAAFLAGNEAFNRGDFPRAFAGLPSDCEWHPFEDMPERVLRGRGQVCRFFEQEIFGMFPDWRSEPLYFVQAAEGVFVVLFRGLGTGQASGVRAGVDLAEVWELRDGAPRRVREFTTWEAAFEAAGLEAAAAAEVRQAST